MILKIFSFASLQELIAKFKVVEVKEHKSKHSSLGVLMRDDANELLEYVLIYFGIDNGIRYKGLCYNRKLSFVKLMLDQPIKKRRGHD